MYIAVVSTIAEIVMRLCHESLAREIVDKLQPLPTFKALNKVSHLTLP